MGFRGSVWMKRVRLLAVILVSVMAIVVPAAAQQTTLPDGIDDPLRPADTSSPRATLRSFLTNVNQAVEIAAAGGSADYAARRAMRTLDFSITPNGHTWSERIIRVLLLKEVLDRIDLPPFSEIPGDRELADGALTAWTIPGTPITIAQVAQGTRAGQFLFSAETIEQIDRLYRQIKDRPYQPGATEGIYEAYLRSDSYLAFSEMRNRLKPIDTSSPRSTAAGFLYSVNRAYRLIWDARAALAADPPQITLDEARAVERLAGNYLLRAVHTLDLSQVPEALRADVGLESALQLKEIFDRLLLPPIDAIPYGAMVAAARRGESLAFAQSSGPLRWGYPDTEIEIVEIADGDRQGQFLFSAATVDQIGGFYEKVKDLPYRQATFGGTEREYLSPELSPGFFEFYIATPGNLIPETNLLGRLVLALPDSLQTVHGGQTVWQWIGLALGVLVVAGVAIAVFWIARRIAAGREAATSEWLKLPSPIVIGALVIALVQFADADLNVTGAVLSTVIFVGRSLVVLLLAWVVFIICRAVSETIIAAPSVLEGSIDATLWRIGGRVVGFLLAIWIIVAGVREVGIDVLPLVAGLGVGGLAVALAAQRAIANFIGSMILFINKPVRVGDFCRYGDQIGTVESIGLYSTRIRSLERTIITVPNAEFSEMKLDNFAKRDQRLLKTVLGLRYETTPEQMRFILVKLRELLLGHPMVSPDPARVRFVNFNAYSKDVEIFCYVLTADHNIYLGIKEDLLLRMEDIINAAGSGFAFPSQTAYLTRDGGLDAERTGSAEAEVESWRQRGELAFPEFDPDERERLIDNLDFPQKGSPDYHPRIEPVTPRPKPAAPLSRSDADYERPSETLADDETRN